MGQRACSRCERPTLAGSMYKSSFNDIHKKLAATEETNYESARVTENGCKNTVVPVPTESADLPVYKRSLPIVFNT